MNSHLYMQLQRREALVLLLLVALVYGCPATLRAQVTNTADSGAGSLRQAIADASPGASIGFDPSLSGQAITLTTGELVISKDLTVAGLGASQLAVSGNFASRVFNVTAGTVTISGLTIRDGSSGSQNPGGGISNSSSLTLADCVVSNNTSGNGGLSSDGAHGGGIYSSGSALALDQSTVSNNATGTGGLFGGHGGSGGGIYVAAGTLTVTESSVRNNNTAAGTLGDNGGEGGGIAFVGSTLTITGSTLSGNSTGNGFAIGGRGGHGGGLYVGAGTLTMTNSTVSSNVTGDGGSDRNGGDGGGIYASGTSAAINNTTISYDTTGIGGSGTGVDGRGGGLFNNAGTLTLYSALVAKNNATTGPDLSGIFSSNGFNLVGNGDGSSGLTNGVNNDQVGDTVSPVDPLLNVLGDYGGTTQTHGLQPGSPAVDKGDCSVTSPASDQRAEARIYDEPAVPDAGDGCDAGAVEGTASELPIELASFEAVIDGTDVHLAWTTLSESDNAGFDVEMRTAESEFDRLGWVPGEGSTSKEVHYAYRVSGLETATYFFRLKQVDYAGSFSYSSVVEVSVLPPASHRLRGNYPNPFNPTTTISYDLARVSESTLTVYDVLGREVTVLASGTQEAGTHEISFDGAGLPSGIYFYRLRAGDYLETRRMTVVR